MAANSLSTIHRTQDSATGLTAIEEWLVKEYLKDREYQTVLANTRYASIKNLPRREGQSVKFTRRKPLRLPEVAKEGKDPQSGATLSYEQIKVPIEEINDYIEITKWAGITAWMDLANDAKMEIRTAMRRYLHYALQGAMHVGRYKPGHRDENGETFKDNADSNYPDFWSTAEATPMMYGGSFTFLDAPKYYTGDGSPATFNELEDNTDAAHCHRMVDYEAAAVRLANAGAPKINGGYVAVISDSIKYDLMRDDDYFALSIRDAEGQGKLKSGMMMKYKGINWVMDDEPLTLAANAGNQGGSDTTGVARAIWGYNHVAQMFGMDSFGYLRLGGRNAARGVSFKVQDITRTGASYTIGYRVPFQAMVLNPAWCCEIIGPVTISARNNNGSMIT